MSTGYTEQELAGLSDEERAAVLGDDENHEAGEAGDDPASSYGDDSENDATADADADENENEDEDIDGDNDATADTDDKLSTDDDDKTQTDKAAPKERQPEQVWLPENVADAFKAKLDSLTLKFDEGKITLAKLLDGRDQINREIYNAEAEAAKQVTAANVWHDAQDAFFKDNKHYFDDQKRYSTLNVCVKAMAASDKAATMTLPEILAMAKKMEEHMSGVTPAAEEKSKKTVPKSKLPEHQSLADLPATALTETSKPNEFSYMDKLTGLEYEQAIDKMSETQRERFLKG